MVSKVHLSRNMRPIIIIFFVLGLLLLVFSIVSAKTAVYFKFTIESHNVLGQIAPYISIHNLSGDTVYASTDERQFKEFRRLGYEFTIISPPRFKSTPKMANTVDAAMGWDVYPTYEVYDSLMHKFADDYPAICAFVDAGYSELGRDILFVKISDNVNLEENEPEIQYSSTMHGDETVGYIMMLHLIDSLLTGYGVDSLITRLVDSCEIWINPLANPDGTYYGGNSTVNDAIRRNSNGIDLNRSFLCPVCGDHPDGDEYQMETIAMMELAEAHSFVLSANFHSGAELVNYPWDIRTICYDYDDSTLWFHVDDDRLETIARDYADSAQFYSPSGYMTDQFNGITHGGTWYSIFGGRQDYMTYFHGCREMTIELSHEFLMSESDLIPHWNYNKVSLLNYMENALYGIRGIVSDSISDTSLYAGLNVIDLDSAHQNSYIYTDPDVGDYYRMLTPGSYDLEFRACECLPKIINGVTVSENMSTVVDVELYRICGNVNDDNAINIFDITYLISYLYLEGPPPDPMAAADVNLDELINIFDITYLISYLYLEGYCPCFPPWE